MNTRVTVQVWGKPHEVSVYQKSKNVWIAAGTYMGERIEVKDLSYGSAVKRWREAATYRDN
jgi:hypothetical protein